jgi:hypothetical protein
MIARASRREGRALHDRPPFDRDTVVDATELADWLSLEAHEVKALTLAGVLKRGAGMFPLVEAIRAYIRFAEAREANAAPPPIATSSQPPLADPLFDL